MEVRYPPRTRPALRSSTIRQARAALRSKTLAQKSSSTATSVERFSTAHRLPTTPLSATTELAVHMALAARQFSMTHQLRPTLPSITLEAVPPPPLVAP